jgi:hypothetical protein
MARQSFSQRELALLCLTFVIPSEVACPAVALCEGWEESLDISLKKIIPQERETHAPHDSKDQFCACLRYFEFSRRDRARVANAFDTTGRITGSLDLARRFSHSVARPRANAFNSTRAKCPN